MLAFMTRLAKRYEPIDGFFSDVIFGISFVMNLGSASTAINTAPIVSFEDYIPFSPPGI